MADLTPKEKLENMSSRFKRFKNASERGMKVLVGGGIGAAVGAAEAIAYVYTDDKDDDGNKVSPRLMGVPATAIGALLSAGVAATSKSEMSQVAFTNATSAFAALATSEIMRKKVQEWKDKESDGAGSPVKQVSDATQEALRRITEGRIRVGEGHPAGNLVRAGEGGLS